MAGNTRGKLKEHFEGIHKNLDWVINHVNDSLNLISTQITAQNEYSDPKLTTEELQAKIDEYPLYKGIKSMGEGVQLLDEIAGNIYSKI